jgi:hypothetical protein
MNQPLAAQQPSFNLPDRTSSEVRRATCPPLGSTDIRSPSVSFTNQMTHSSAFGMPDNEPTELLEDGMSRNNLDQMLEDGTHGDFCWPSAEELSHSMEPVVSSQKAAQNDHDEASCDFAALHESLQHSQAEGLVDHRELDSHKLASSVDVEHQKETASLQDPHQGVFKKPTAFLSSAT